MAILKCKMCGGALAPAPDSTIAECEYCGSLQTLPRVSDDRLGSLYERANDLRMSHEFDKAIEVYEKIIEENPTDADAYWSMVLCKYGIEYVDDPATGKKIPTCHRTSYDAITTDVEYLSAIKYADAAQRGLYEAEAKAINDIQKSILSIVKDEKPFDVFICYKESDEYGHRTVDSSIANDIYYQLTNEGLKVFYAAITLEDKLGREYEPYIFAALNSAKVMLVVGTKPEYFNAVWVKNEWSRYLQIVRKDRSKLLIPCYKDMNAYNLPEEFSHLQAHDMSKIGFITDLIRGIKKVVGKENSGAAGKENSKATSKEDIEETIKKVLGNRTTAAAPSGNVENLLQRVSIFLEDQDWSSANIYCEKILDIAPTNGQAYLYKLLTEARVTSEAALKNYPTALDGLRAYKNAVRYADEATSANLIAYNQEIKKRLADERERARIAEEYRQKGESLQNARSYAASLLSSQVQEKERLESLLGDNEYALKNLKKHRRKIVIPALICIVFALIIFIALVNDDGEVGPTLYVFQFIPAIVLAHARDRSKLGAFFMTLISVGLIPGISGIRGLIEAAQESGKGTQSEQESIKNSIRQMEEQIATSRSSLSELNAKIEEHNASRR